MAHLRRYLAALLIMTLGAAALGDDTAYSIHIHRKDKVGDISDTHITLEDMQTTVVTVQATPAPQIQRSNIKADLQGRVEVLEVNDKGDATSLKLTVKKFTDEKGADLVESGKVIQAKWGDKQIVFSIAGGGEISSNARKVLAKIYDLHADNVDDDDVFGSKIPRKVGESWPINSEAAAKSFSAHELPIDPNILKGRTTLGGIEPVGRGKALRITATMDSDGFKFPGLPPELSVDNSTLRCKFGGLFPADESAKATEEEMTMDMQVTLSGNGTKVETKAHSSMKTTRMPVSN